MPLSSIVKGTRVTPRKILVYGVHGIGKSTFGSDAEKPIFIQTEEGLEDIDCERFPIAKTFRDVMNHLGDLYKEDHEYRTIVIDSLDWLERLVWSDVVARFNLRSSKAVSSIDEIGYGKGYGFALTQWKEILEGLEAILKLKGLSIVLIAHSKIETFRDPENEAYDRYSPRLHKHASSIIQEWCTEVLFANYKVSTVTRSEAFEPEKESRRAIGTGQRILKTVERPSHMAKNRLGLPDEIPLDYEVFASYVRGDNRTQTEQVKSNG